ncbi:MAG: hypothetical protein NZL89_06630 [Leptospiraceae bacterium]|nr:hypothetical protein [Leptospiraceae bacterium]
MRRVLFLLFLASPIAAGPEIFDPLAVWKNPNAPSKRPLLETVFSSGSTELARYHYRNNQIVRIDYLKLDGKKEIPAGHSLLSYEDGLLSREQLFDETGKLCEEVRYLYRNGRAEKMLVRDVRGNAHIEWHYFYDKNGNLISGRRLLEGKTTESFKIVRDQNNTIQKIFNARGELTAEVTSVYENGRLVHRRKNALTGTKYADYKYDSEGFISEIVYHDTERGQKVFAKKHTFSYSKDHSENKTALAR